MYEFVIVLIILLIAWFALNRESMSAVGYGRKDINDHRRIYFHYTNWCSYCRAMKPVWEDVIAATYGSGIEFIPVDEEVSKTPGITSYPTIVMLSEQGHTYKYKGGANFERLRNWAVSPNPIEL